VGKKTFSHAWLCNVVRADAVIGGDKTKTKRQALLDLDRKYLWW